MSRWSQLLLCGLILSAVLVGRSFGQDPTDPPATQPSGRDATTRPAGTNAVVITLEGMIDDFNRDSLRRRFATARELGADVVILKLNTFGGLVTSGLDISRFIKQQDDIHVICFVHEKAISAGAMIAVACDEIVMEPHSQIGDSGVIRGDGQEMRGTERAKGESIVVEDFRDSARRNGHPEVLLEAMVILERTVHWIENTETGERKFVDGEQYNRLTRGGVFGDSPWRAVPGVRNPIDAEDTLLTLPAELAVKIGLASGEYRDVESFAASRGYTIIATLSPGFGESIIGLLSSLPVRGLLVTVLMFSLYMAFSQPGTGAPEAIAVIALAVLLGVPALTGHAEWYEILAVLLGVVLIAVEIFITPGFGFFGVTGVFLVLGGLAMSFVPPIDMPTVPTTWDGQFSWQPVREGIMVTLAGMISSLLLWWWLSRYLPKIPYVNRLVLTTTVGETLDPVSGMPVAQSPVWPEIGAEGLVITDLRPGGVAQFYDPQLNDHRRTDVVTDRGFIPAGTKVQVKENRDNRVVVRAMV